MNKENLELAMRIAEIEGEWAVTCRDGHLFVLRNYMESPNHPLPTHYNPFHWSILGPLMVKYGVNIEHLKGAVSANICGSPNGRRHFNISTEDPRIEVAILGCIVKAYSK